MLEWHFIHELQELVGYFGWMMSPYSVGRYQIRRTYQGWADRLYALLRRFQEQIERLGTVLSPQQEFLHTLLLEFAALLWRLGEEQDNEHDPTTRKQFVSLVEYTDTWFIATNDTWFHSVTYAMRPVNRGEG